MRNLVDYFSENVNVSFEELPFNELDAAIFFFFFYINFDKFVSPYKYQKKKLSRIASIIIKNETKKTFRLKEDKEIVQLIQKSKRCNNFYKFG